MSFLAGLCFSAVRASSLFPEGAEITPGRSVLKTLGRTAAARPCSCATSACTRSVAKVLRPDQAEDEKALCDLRREAEALERSRPR